MGNSQSISTEKPDLFWTPEETIRSTQTETQTAILNEPKSSTTNTDEAITLQNTEETINEYEHARKLRREEKLKQFKTDLEKKHLARKEIIAERSREISFLREELIKYKKENELLKAQSNDDLIIESENIELDKLRVENGELKEMIEDLKKERNQYEEITQHNKELRKDIASVQTDLQSVNTQVLEFEKERQDYQAHVVALKDVIHVSKSLLQIRENQLQELKSKVAEIETSLAEREASMLSSNLRDEYERQLRNIRALRTMYDQRQAATQAEKDLLESRLTEIRKTLEDEQSKNGELEERVTELENKVWDRYEEIKNLESQLGLSKAEFRGLEAEMTVINQLFSQILFGFNNNNPSQGIDFDKLVKLLEENHDLLTDIIENEESDSISAALPKVLLDLVNRVNEENKTESSGDECTNYQTGTGLYLPTIPEESAQIEHNNQMQSAEEIVTKLPKVWRVLIELLRQQRGQQPVDIQEDSDPCYKSVQTPKGPKLVLSVSKTFIRLKDLILEKKSLEKEMSRLKQLNSHLEVRLQDQEKRLETVSTELSKTWHVVGRMQKQHQQLHTHEKILRYELGQKRKMLTELKEELEYCREKWVQAREKNSNTEAEWKKLRKEFAARKNIVVDELNNSGESGYSDERECSSDDDVTMYNNRKKKSDDDIEENKSEVSDTDDLSSHRSDVDDPGIQKGADENLEIVEPQENAKNINIEDENICTNNSETLVEQPTKVPIQLEIEETQHSTTQEYLDETAPEKDLEKIITNSTSLADMMQEFFRLELSQKSTTQTEDLSDPPPEPNTTQKPEEDQPQTSEHNDKTEDVQNLEETKTLESSKANISHDEMLVRREARLQRLEEQCQQLVTKVTNTNVRSRKICNRLEMLHEQYGGDNTPNSQSTHEEPTASTSNADESTIEKDS